MSIIRNAALERIDNICKERGLSKTGLARLAGLTPSTIYSMTKHEDIGITLLKKICDGLDMSLMEFFNDDIFHALQQEIK